MMPDTNIDLLKCIPETHRPLTEHERTVIAMKREAKRAERTKTLGVLRRLIDRLGHWIEGRPAKV
ncbi:hypothetical protein SAMN04488042_1149 [Shimia aestuarii]|uniref:Transposase n=1 Tax=Shimia aestuarii TaxID=254406 RepID=A0A1I4T5X0_9RHOB|nr:hypothetical protein SAMN04488042_1149 [Shimia aestuarii]